MEQADTEVRIAKKDIYADIDEGVGVPIRRLIATKGQQIPRAFSDLVDDKDVTSEIPVTESVASRATAVRRQRGPAEEVSHEEFREAAAAADPEPLAPAEAPDGVDVTEPETDAKAKKAEADKRRKAAANKARKSASSK